MRELVKRFAEPTQAGRSRTGCARAGELCAGTAHATMERRHSSRLL